MADGEAGTIAKRAVELVQELGEDDADTVELKEFQAARAEAAKKAKGPAAEALPAAMAALEHLLQVAVKTQILPLTDVKTGKTMGGRISLSGSKAHLVKAKLTEIMWLAKDAAALCEELGEAKGRAAALKTLTRVHLIRADQPDAPAAALRAIKEAVSIYEGLGEMKKEAEALLVLSEAQLAKASMSPFDKVKEAGFDGAVQTCKDADSIFKKLKDKKGQGLANHSTALALLAACDEDKAMEAERIADDAAEFFRDQGEKELEAKAVFTCVNAIVASTGPESAVMRASDAATDWNREGGRQLDEAAAWGVAAELYLASGQTTEAIQACKDAYRLYDNKGKKKLMAGVLQTRSSCFAAMEEKASALQALSEASGILQQLGEKREEGRSLLMTVEYILGSLMKEVEADTHDELDKTEHTAKITIDEVYERTEEALEYASKALACFEACGDQLGMQMVQNLIQSNYQKGIDLYCQHCEPDNIVSYLKPVEQYEDFALDKVKKEWKIRLPTVAQAAREAGEDDPEAGVLTVSS